MGQRRQGCQGAGGDEDWFDGPRREMDGRQSKQQRQQVLDALMNPEGEGGIFSGRISSPSTS